MTKTAGMDTKVILITGASSGIGCDTAKTLAEQGHRVYGAARRTERLEPLRAYGVTPLKMDVTEAASREAGVDLVTAKEGRIDVLVNNAGYGAFGAVENVSLEEARRQLDVNVFGLAELTRLVLPVMRVQQAGRIINVASIAGRLTLRFGTWYHVSKYAVEAFSEALRMEVRPFGIEVVIIDPGGIKTEWGFIAADHLEASSLGTVYEQEALYEAAALRKAYSMKLLSSPHVVARAIARAVNRPHPKTRYTVGFGARFLLALHALLPDRGWDALMRWPCKRSLLRQAPK